MKQFENPAFLAVGIFMMVMVVVTNSEPDPEGFETMESRYATDAQKGEESSYTASFSGAISNFVSGGGGGGGGGKSITGFAKRCPTGGVEADASYRSQSNNECPTVKGNKEGEGRSPFAVLNENLRINLP